MRNLKNNNKSRHQIFTYFDEEGKICDREGELDQQSIFTATFREISHYFHGKYHVSAKGSIKIEPKSIFSPISSFTAFLKFRLFTDGRKKRDKIDIF